MSTFLEKLGKSAENFHDRRFWAEKGDLDTDPFDFAQDKFHRLHCYLDRITGWTGFEYRITNIEIRMSK